MNPIIVNREKPNNYIICEIQEDTKSENIFDFEKARELFNFINSLHLLIQEVIDIRRVITCFIKSDQSFPVV